MGAIQPAQPEVRVRNATLDDVDAMLSIGLSAFPMNPQWRYRYSYSQEFPDDHASFSRRRIEEYLTSAQTGSRQVMLAELPSIEDANIWKPVSLIVWWMPGYHLMHYEKEKSDQKAQAFMNNQLTRRDGHAARIRRFREVLDASKANYFDSRFGENQLYVYNLATHADYQRRGAATALMKWGLDSAEETKMPVALFASEIGKTLYTKLGFQEVGSATVQVEGEEEKFVTPAMLFLPGSMGERDNSWSATAAARSLVRLLSNAFRFFLTPFFGA